MIGDIHTGQMGFGFAPAPIPAKLVNRVGVTLQDGEVLMLDMENAAYGTTADENGVFGNGITPAVAGTGGVDAVGLYWPLALVINGWGTAAGTVIDVLATGIGVIAATNVGAIAAIKGTGFEIVAGTRNPNIRNAAMNAQTRVVGFTLQAHTAAVGVERVMGTFNGLQSR